MGEFWWNAIIPKVYLVSSSGIQIKLLSGVYNSTFSLKVTVFLLNRDLDRLTAGCKSRDRFTPACCVTLRGCRDLPKCSSGKVWKGNCNLLLGLETSPPPSCNSCSLISRYSLLLIKETGAVVWARTWCNFAMFLSVLLFGWNTSSLLSRGLLILSLWNISTSVLFKLFKANRVYWEMVFWGAERRAPAYNRLLVMTERYNR